MDIRKWYTNSKITLDIASVATSKLVLAAGGDGKYAREICIEFMRLKKKENGKEDDTKKEDYTVCSVYSVKCDDNRQSVSQSVSQSVCSSIFAKSVRTTGPIGTGVPPIDASIRRNDDGAGAVSNGGM